jgi:hypothetical protein
MLLSLAYEVTNYSEIAGEYFSGYFMSKERAEAAAETHNLWVRRGFGGRYAEIIERHGSIFKFECEDAEEVSA